MLSAHLYFYVQFQPEIHPILKLGRLSSSQLLSSSGGWILPGYLSHSPASRARIRKSFIVYFIKRADKRPLTSSPDIIYRASTAGGR